MSEVRQIPPEVAQAITDLSASDAFKTLLQWAWEEQREGVFESPERLPAVQSIEWLAGVSKVNLILKHNE